MNTQRLLSLAVAAALCAGLPSVVSASGAIAGATEPTQLLNNVELAASYVQHVRKVAKQIENIRELEKHLKQLNPARAQSLLKDFRGLRSIDELRDAIDQSKRLGDVLSDLDTDMATILYEHENAARVLGNLNRRNVRATGGDIMRGMHELSVRRGREYERRVREYTRALESAQNNIQRVERITQDAPEIKSTVEGLSALQVSNGQMLVQLADMQAVNAQAAIDTAKLAAVADKQSLQMVEEQIGQEIIIADLVGQEAFERMKQSSRR